MKRHLRYAQYLIRHKWFVFWAGVQIGPVHFWQWPFWILTLLIHDWDKLLPDMWCAYARCFYAADGTKQYKPTSAFDRTWNRHQKWSKHHWQHWVLLKDDGTFKELYIPNYWVREMVADWRGAGRAIVGPGVKTSAWYDKEHKNIKMDLGSRVLVVWLLYRRNW